MVDLKGVKYFLGENLLVTGETRTHVIAYFAVGKVGCNFVAHSATNQRLAIEQQRFPGGFLFYVL